MFRRLLANAVHGGGTLDDGVIRCRLSCVQVGSDLCTAQGSVASRAEQNGSGLHDQVDLVGS